MAEGKNKEGRGQRRRGGGMAGLHLLKGCASSIQGSKWRWSTGEFESLPVLHVNVAAMSLVVHRCHELLEPETAN